ncbi:MAG TPA: FAD-binding oxidoreductase [Solirubrobacteraceae bacterium]|nr:FAD-binding oxidoreductase [Solirubrobacteraceae bacterium]
MPRDLLAFPGEERYETARRSFNLAIDQRPKVIALPRSEQEVVAAVQIAADLELSVAPQLTGHGASSLPSLERTMLLRTDRLREVDIDLRHRRARVSAGVQWQDVVPRASRSGLAALHGTAPDVGVVGYTLGGGLSWYARRHGLAVNHVTAAELVTAGGQVRRVDHDHDADLFWALRGGGGNFGVVTALEFELVPVPELLAGALFYPLARADQVLHAWRSWLAAVPEELTSIGRILRFPPLPEVPEPLRGNAFALVEAVFLGSESDGAELLEPLRRLGPALDTVAAVGPADISGLHMDPPDPLPYVGDGQLLEHLPAGAIDEIVRLDGADSGSPLMSFELRHLGGALARQDPSHGALGAPRGTFAAFGGGMTPDPAATTAMRERLAMLRAALEPYDSGYSFPNFAMQSVDPSRFFPDAVLRRLREIRAEVDPDGVFVAKHAI